MFYFRKVFTLLYTLCSAGFVFGQSPIADQTYWVYLTDKQYSAYSLERPDTFLSERTLERRRRLHIPVSYSDLPVSAVYIKQVEAAGARVITTSRWLNALSIQVEDTSILKDIAALDCVLGIENVKTLKREPEQPVVPSVNLRTADEGYYGLANNQFSMLGGPYMHTEGFTGEDMVIAVLDAGFIGVDTGVGFTSVWDKGQVLGYWNFPDNNDSVFISSYHGTYVFSIMAADMPGIYVGAAPDAKYYLFRTEIADSELVAEEHFWLAAAEQADFLGADIINSSLSYTEFDNPGENHTYADLDGNTTVITRAADIAASKGIIVCTAAGNYANDPWHCIGAPADGDSVFTIGSVDGDRRYSLFSSVGPTADGRIKPDIATQGGNAAVLNPDGYPAIGSGTSYASPLAAGATAILWQAFPGKSNMEIMSALKQSASLALTPDNRMGWGIPNLFLARLILQGFQPQNSGILFSVFPNPVKSELKIVVYDTLTADARIEIFEVGGRKVFSMQPGYSDAQINTVRIPDLPLLLADGVYIMRIATNKRSETAALIIAGPYAK